MFIIYCIINKVNGKRYVGQTSQKLCRRWGTHLCNTKHGRGAHLNNAIRMYGRDNFTIAQIAEASNHPATDAAERAFIKIYKTTDPEFGYNLTTGGEAGKKHTSIAIEKMRQAHKGILRTEEAKQKTSESLKKAWAEGRHTGTIGKILPESHRIKASLKSQGKKHPMYRHDISTEEIINLRKQGVLVKDICAKFGINASLVERRLNKVGVKFSRPRLHINYNFNIDPQITELHKQGKNPFQISKIVGVNHKTVAHHINYLGL